MARQLSDGRRPTRSAARLLNQMPQNRGLWTAKVVFEVLVEALIEHGIGSPLAERLLRAAYVRESAGTVRRGWGDGPNVSQISIKTGLERHLVKAILSNEREALRIPSGRRDPVSRVVEGWATDRDYMFRNRPRDLALGDRHSKGRTVWSLIERYAPGISPRLIIDELIRVNAVSVLPNGKLRWSTATRQELPDRLFGEGENLSVELRKALRALLGTNEKHSKKWRKAQSIFVHADDAPVLRKLLNERVDAMFSWLTDELMSSRWRRAKRGEFATRVGILGFNFEETVGKASGDGKL
jgi:hypothetical protein